MRLDDAGDVRERDDLHRIEWGGGRREGVQGEGHRFCLTPGVIDDHREGLIYEQGHRGTRRGLGFVNFEVIGHQGVSAGHQSTTHRATYGAHDVDRLLAAKRPLATAAGEFTGSSRARDVVLTTGRAVKG